MVRLGFELHGCRMVGADKTTVLWRSPGPRFGFVSSLTLIKIEWACPQQGGGGGGWVQV